MSIPTPPPERPMDADARARVRARLLEETRLEPHPQRPWLLPIGAAAAVLVIAFGAGYAAFRPAAESAPAPTPATTRPSPTEAVEPTEPIVTNDVGPGEQEGQIAREGCGKAVDGPLDGNLEEVRTWPLPDGEASIWATEDGRSVLCAQNAEITTLHRVRPYPVGQFEQEMLGWSTDTYEVQGGFRTAYVAGGPLPEGVTGLSYLFPDGHEERAIIKDGWWLMAYASAKDLLAQNGLTYMRVTVALSGMQYDYDLFWPEHMCAQVNHGC